MKKVRFLLLYGAFLALFLLLSLEVVLRLGYFEPTFSSKAATKVTLDRKLLFKVVPHSNVTINGHGYRDREFPEKSGQRKRILFLGDSLVFGIGVQHFQTLPKALEDMLAPGAEVFNMGMYGYGPDQSLMQLTTQGLALDPDMVILGVFAANDFGDIIKNDLYRLDEGGEIRYNPDNLVGGNIPRLRSRYLYQFLRLRSREKQRGAPPNIGSQEFEHVFTQLMSDGYDLELMTDPDSPVSRRKKQLMGGILRGFRRALNERGIPFLVVIIPNAHNVEEPEYFEGRGIPPERRFYNEAVVAELCREESIPYIDLSEQFLERTARSPGLYEAKHDHHLSVYGNLFAAAVIRPVMIRMLKE
jgi:hypothetical protein